MTFEEIWLLIILILPGFLAIRLFAYITIQQFKLDNYTILASSLIISLVFVIPLFGDKLFDYESLLFDFKSDQSSTFVSIFLLYVGAILFSAIIGIIIKYTKRKNYVRSSPWDTFANEYLGMFVIIHTSDTKKYYGWIKRMSVKDDENRSLALGDPQLLIKDKEPKIIGKEILLLEHSIIKIIFDDRGQEPL